MTPCVDVFLDEVVFNFISSKAPPFGRGFLLTLDSMCPNKRSPAFDSPADCEAGPDYTGGPTLRKRLGLRSNCESVRHRDIWSVTGPDH
jgi:hypothetical protein